MSSQEDTDREQQEDVVRTGSQQGVVDSTAIGSAVENGSERAENRRENAQELPSGDTGFFETSEDCGVLSFFFWKSSGNARDLIMPS